MSPLPWCEKMMHEEGMHMCRHLIDGAIDGVTVARLSLVWCSMRSASRSRQMHGGHGDADRSALKQLSWLSEVYCSKAAHCHTMNDSLSEVRGAQFSFECLSTACHPFRLVKAVSPCTEQESLPLWCESAYAWQWKCRGFISDEETSTCTFCPDVQII